MKYRIFILPLLLGPISASAFDISVYYDANGVCNGFCKVRPNGTDCCPTSSIAAETEIAEKFMSLATGRDEEFSGFEYNGTQIIDSNGNFELSIADIVNLNMPDNVTVQTNNSCKTGTELNTHGVCVNARALENPEGENVAYIDWTSVLNNANGDSGYEIEPSQIKGDNGKSCYYDRDFDIVIHWCPKNYSAVNYSYGGAHIAYGDNPVDWTALPCNQENETWHYHWNGGTSLGVYTKNGQTKTEIVFPNASGWSPRGFYIVKYPEYKPSNTLFNNIPYYSLLKTIADNLVTEQSTTWGRARLGLPFNQANVTDRIILNNTVNGYGDANANWQIWTCDGDVETIDLYAAWARDCAPGDGATCTRQIQRHGLSNPDKGDAMYYTSCTSGTLSGDGTYNPSCGDCSATNLGQCSKKDCVFSNAHWCYIDGDLLCVSNTITHDGIGGNCCTDNIEACQKKWVCEEMGGVWTGGTDETGDYCTAGATPTPGGGDTFQCPTLIAAIPKTVTLESSNFENQTCTYKVNCDTGYTVSPMTPLTCTGTDSGSDACTSGALTAKLNDYTCTPQQTPTFQCPTATELQLRVPDLNIKVNESGDCTYQLSCNQGYTLSGGTGQITCNNISACVTAMSGYQCMLTCPSVPSINNGTISKTDGINSCSYSLTCNDGYAVPDESANTTYNCTGDGCTSTGVNSWANALECKQKLTFAQCSAEFAEGDDGQAGGITGVLSENDTKCTFTANCDLLLCNAGSLGDTYCAGAKTCDSVSDCAQLAREYATVSCSNAKCPTSARMIALNLVPHATNFNVTSNSGTCSYTAFCSSPGYECGTSGTCSATCNKADNGCAKSKNWYTSMKCNSASGDMPNIE